MGVVRSTHSSEFESGASVGTSAVGQQARERSQAVQISPDGRGSGRRNSGQWLVAAAAIVGVAVAAIFLMSLSAPAGAQFDDEARPGTCVLNETVETDLSQGQCDALNALYWATRGPDWTNQRGWATATDPCTWGGVSCAPGNGHAVIERIELQNNGLSGYLPEQVEGLRWLRKLSLSSNDIGSVIPERLGLLQQLRVLDLSGNRFDGEVPARLGDLRELRVLNLSDNDLSGEVPPRIALLGQLTRLQLERNDCLVVLTATARAMPDLVEGAFLDHCARVQVASTCLAGAGRLDVTISNESAVSRDYVATIGSLYPRHRNISPGDTSTVVITGRHDGVVPVEVHHGDVVLQSVDVHVDCDLDISATPHMRCVGDQGRLDVLLTNAGIQGRSVRIEVNDLPARSVMVAAGSIRKVTIAVDSGRHIVRVSAGADVLAPLSARSDCT